MRGFDGRLFLGFGCDRWMLENNESLILFGETAKVLRIGGMWWILDLLYGILDRIISICGSHRCTILILINYGYQLSAQQNNSISRQIKYLSRHNMQSSDHL